MFTFRKRKKIVIWHGFSSLKSNSKSPVLVEYNTMHSISKRIIKKEAWVSLMVFTAIDEWILIK